MRSHSVILDNKTIEVHGCELRTDHISSFGMIQFTVWSLEKGLPHHRVYLSVPEWKAFRDAMDKMIADNAYDDVTYDEHGRRREQPQAPPSVAAAIIHASVDVPAQQQERVS